MSSKWTMPPELFAGMIKEDHKKKVVEVGLAVDRELVANTPVDTGRAQSNWIPSVDAPVNAENGPLIRQVLSQRALSAWRVNDMKDFPKLYLTNSLPYIQRLNEGWSQQAPSMFVESAVERVINAYKNAP